MGSNANSRSSGRSTFASRLQLSARRTRSPTTRTLFPVAKIVPRHSHSGTTLCPKIRVLTMGWVRIWHNRSDSRSNEMLSSETMVPPSSRIAPSRFLHFFGGLAGCDDRARAACHDGRDQVHEIAFAIADIMRPDHE